jgi:hypothetical protein
LADDNGVVIQAGHFLNTSNGIGKKVDGYLWHYDANGF